jgi:hypothetical protein
VLEPQGITGNVKEHYRSNWNVKEMYRSKMTEMGQVVGHVMLDHMCWL